MCVGEDDVYFNYIIEKDQLMNDLVLWHGTSKNNPILIHMLIEALFKLGVKVVDITTSTSRFPVSISTFVFQYTLLFQYFYLRLYCSLNI